MTRYAPFDMLREGGDQLPDLRGELQEDRIAEGRLNQEAVLDQPGFTSRNPQDAMNMRRAGMFEQPDGTFIDPYRLVAQERRGRINLAQKRNEEQKQAIADSMLFKVGDTLADTGRMFLSPLFWLKGEDTTKYDPSARLKTGYRNQFESLEQLRSENVTKFLTSRNQRLAAAATLSNNQRSQQIQAMSPFEKDLQGFAVRKGLQSMYQDPAQVGQLAQMLRLEKGQAIRFGDTVIDAQLHKTVLGRAEKFETVTSGYRDALQGYSALKASLGSGNAVGNIAAVFTFMKTLDPNSVVREGEFQLAAQAGGLHTKLMSMVSNVKTGEFIRPEVAQEMLEVAGEIAALYEGKYNEKRGRYATEFSKYQYSEDDIKTLLGDEVSLNAGDDQKAPDNNNTPELVVASDTDDPASAALNGYIEVENEVPPNGE